VEVWALRVGQYDELALREFQGEAEGSAGGKQCGQSFRDCFDAPGEDTVV